MSTRLPKPWTLDDFLAWEERQAERYEFVGGVVRMMVGGTAAHNRITLNLAFALQAALRGSGCSVFSSDMKTVSLATGEAAYPDVLVTCRPVNPADTSLAEPALVAEVLSRSTADHDRGAKFEMYRTIPTLRYYLLVSQDRRRADLYRRTTVGWELITVDGTGEIELAGFGCTLDLDAIYEDSGL